MASSVALLGLALCTLWPWVEARGSAVALVVPPRKLDCMYHEASAAGRVEFRVLVRSGGARDIRVKVHRTRLPTASSCRPSRAAEVLGVHAPGPGVLGICFDNAASGVAAKVVEVSVVEEGRSAPADEASMASLSAAMRPLERAVHELAGHLRAIHLASDRQTRFVRDIGAKVGLLTTTETAIVAGLAVAQVLVLRRVLASRAVAEALGGSV